MGSMRKPGLDRVRTSRAYVRIGLGGDCGKCLSWIQVSQSRSRVVPCGRRPHSLVRWDRRANPKNPPVALASTHEGRTCLPAECCTAPFAAFFSCQGRAGWLCVSLMSRCWSCRWWAVWLVCFTFFVCFVPVCFGCYCRLESIYVSTCQSTYLSTPPSLSLSLSLSLFLSLSLYVCMYVCLYI